MISREIHADQTLASAVSALVLQGASEPTREASLSQEKYIWLRETGSRLWLDTGDAAAAAKAWSPELEGLTTNNTLVNQVVQTGAMDELVAQASRRIREICPRIDDYSLVIEVGFAVNARLALDLVRRFEAFVSVELHPELGCDIEGTVLFARRYFEICPERFYIKVPLTPDGFIAVRRLSAEAIPVNFTLGFSARQNYLAARFSRPAFVNVFLGRLNQVIEENGVGDPANVGEKAALASDELMKNLRASSDVPTQQIAASIRNGKQVATLAGADVLTIPPKSAEEYLESDLTEADVIPRNWRDLTVRIGRSDIEHLWSVNNAFVAFVDDVLRRAGSIKTGADLVKLARRHEINLFHPWTEEHRAAIREKGKIPRLSQFPTAPLDDLMCVAALESFAADQLALDQRIRSLIV